MHLERLHKAKQPVTAMSYEEAVRRADLAGSFVSHPYWEIVSRMLSGTIQSETEQLLSGNNHEDINRASVAICRKVLHMPFIDIEQGQMAERERQRAQAHIARRRGAAS